MKTWFTYAGFIDDLNVLPDKVEIPSFKQKLPELGHAGILFINGKLGTTKYYEFGRYGGPKGQIRKRTIRDVQLVNGHPSKASLGYVLSQISAKSGQKGRIQGAYIEVPNKYQSMLNYANKRHLQNKNPSRREYDILKYSCNHFMKEVLEAASVTLPAMWDPRPNSYISEIRQKFSALDYSLAKNTLVIENPPQSLANMSRSYQPAAA